MRTECYLAAATRARGWLALLFATLLPSVGFAQVTWELHEIEPWPDTWSTHLADIDGDGFLDTLAAPQSGELSWYQNSLGDGSVWTKNIVQPHGTDADQYFWAGWSIFAIDMDGDGDQDIVGGSGYPGGSYTIYEINWWENLNGDGLSWARHTVDSGNIALYWAEPADIDVDGLVDIAVADYDTIKWYKNLGGGAWSKHNLSTAFYGVHAAHPVNVDADAALEIVGASYYNSEVRLWGWGSTAEIQLGSGFSAFSVIGFDADGDGDTDIAGVGGLRYWENTASGWVEHIIDTGAGTYTVKAGDINGDGSVDLVTDGGEPVWFENDGSGGTWTKHYTDYMASNPTSVDLGDVDGNGKLDIAGCGEVAWVDSIFWLENL